MKIVRRHITFYGWVQGVGFRYRARHAAELYGCTGWVRNEWDGSVTMEIQGTEENIDRVILAIESGRYIRIENMRLQMIQASSAADRYLRRTRVSRNRQRLEASPMLWCIGWLSAAGQALCALPCTAE